LRSMRRRAVLTALGAIFAIGLSASALAGVAHGYVNPIKPGRWIAGRIDMGVDYIATRRTGVVAIGDAQIMGAYRTSGWPGGHYLWYQLLNGDHRGDYIYVAEKLRKMKPAGTTVDAGQRIAVAKPGWPGTEWGWATRSGQPRAAPCYSEGMKTHSGKEMARFLASLGAEVADKVRDGPDYPTGTRC